jgi:hypothetical protein
MVGRVDSWSTTEFYVPPPEALKEEAGDLGVGTSK